MKSNRCECFRETICLLANGALSEAERGEVEKHLAACATCRKYFDEIKSLAAPLANWEKNFAAIEPSPAFSARWRNAVHASAKQKSPALIAQVWRELIWPCRKAWTGMAALWLVLWAVNSSLWDGGEKQLLAQSRVSPATWQSLAEQRKLLAELIPPSPSQPAEPPRREHLQPRSERSVPIAFV